MKVVSVIPARGGSKGIPRKNLVPLRGVPLIAHMINTSRNADIDIFQTWVSTDDQEIAWVSRKYGAQVLDRPPELATDEAKSEPVLMHFAENVDFDILVFLQCTSPLLKVQDLNKGIAMVKGKFDSAFSVTTITQFIWKGHGEGALYPIQGYTIHGIKNRSRGQDLKPIHIYRFETGAFYVTTRKALLDSGCRVSGWIGVVEVPFWESFEVDSMEDLKNIERLMECH